MFKGVDITICLVTDRIDAILLHICALRMFWNIYLIYSILYNKINENMRHLFDNPTCVLWTRHAMEQ